MRSTIALRPPVYVALYTGVAKTMAAACVVASMRRATAGAVLRPKSKSAGSKSPRAKNTDCQPAICTSDATARAMNVDREAADGLAARNTMLWLIPILLAARLLHQERSAWRPPTDRKSTRL